MAMYYKCIVAYDSHYNDYDEYYIGAAEDDEAYEIAHEYAHKQHAQNGKEIYDIEVLELGCAEAWDM